MKNKNVLFDEWLSTKPEFIRLLAAEFPLGTTFQLDGVTMYLLGYDKDDSLIISGISPYVDYDGALAASKPIYAKHLRERIVP